MYGDKQNANLYKSVIICRISKRTKIEKGIIKLSKLLSKT